MLLKIVTLAVSIVLIAAVLHDAFEVMLLPRRIKSRTRIVRYFFQGTWRLWSWVGSKISAADQKNSFLGLYGPLSPVLLLFVWAFALIGAFGSIFWMTSPAKAANSDWISEIYFSGVTFFTLGYGDIVPHAAGERLLSVFEAGTGLGFIAMVIGYLPVMYQLFARREAQVIMLDAIAGSPPACMTILCRYAEGQILEALDRFLLQWQHWAADLLESHLSYPVMAYYRSQHDNQSWLAALASIMDLSVIVMTGIDGVRTLQSQLTFATSRLALIELGRVLGAGPRPSAAERLSPEGFGEIRRLLATAGLNFVDEEEAEGRLSAFRETYEPFLNGLSSHLMLSLPPWWSSGSQLDNWANSPRGKSAKRLVDSVEAEPDSKASYD